MAHEPARSTIGGPAGFCARVGAMSSAAMSAVSRSRRQMSRMVGSSGRTARRGPPLAGVGFALEVSAARVLAAQVLRIVQDDRDDEKVVAIGKRDAVPEFRDARA